MREGLEGSRRTAQFFALTYAISWLLWLPLVLGRHVDASIPAWGYLPGVAGPMLAALVLSFRAGGYDGVRRLLKRLLLWRFGPQWYLAAVSIPFAVALAAGALVRALGRCSDLESRGLATVAALLVANVILLPLEEVGWRGYALPRLQVRRSALSASILLGVLWGLWHAPAFWFQMDRQTTFGSPVPSLALFVVFTILVSVVLTWLYNSTRGSLLVVCIFHGAVNASTGLYVLEGAEATDFRLVALVLGLILVVVISAVAGPADLSRVGRVLPSRPPHEASSAGVG